MRDQVLNYVLSNKNTVEALTARAMIRFGGPETKASFLRRLAIERCLIAIWTTDDLSEEFRNPALTENDRQEIAAFLADVRRREELLEQATRR